MSDNGVKADVGVYTCDNPQRVDIVEKSSLGGYTYIQVKVIEEDGKTILYEITPKLTAKEAQATAGLELRRVRSDDDEIPL